MQMECVNQRLRFDVLKKLFTSGKRKHLTELREKVKLRAGYFLKRGKLDYESILSLMVFPVPNRRNLLKSFKKLDGGKAYASVAIGRLNGKKTGYCSRKRRRIPHRLRELCTVRLYR